MQNSAMLSKQHTSLWRWLAGASALGFLGLCEFVLAVLGAYGNYGAAIAFCATPFAFAVRTPRSWMFITGIAAFLSLVPTLIVGHQLLQPRSATRAARVWSSESGWVDLVRPTSAEVAITCTAIAAVLFVSSVAALALWKRVAMRKNGIAAQARSRLHHVGD
jgi:hypothetical protein